MVAIRNAYRPGPAPEPPRAPAQAIELTAGERLLRRIEGFMRQHPEVTAKGFGRMACNNGHLLDVLRQGQTPQPVTIRRVEAFIAGYGR